MDHGNGAVELLNMPRPDERVALQRRHDMLKRSMESSERGHIGATVADMLASYDVHRNRSDEDKLKIIAQFQVDLDGIPTWAVMQACRDIKDGAAADVSHIYAPTTIQVKVEARRHMEPHQVEMRMIREVLDAVPPAPKISAEESLTVGVLVAGLANALRTKELEKSHGPDPDEERLRIIADKVAQKRLNSDASAIRREYAAAGVDPVTLGGRMVSPSLLKSLGKWPPPRGASDRG